MKKTAKKTRAPGAGRPKGSRSALASHMCATIAQRLVEMNGVSAEMAISAAITAVQKLTAKGEQRANFLLLNNGSVRTALTRLRKSQRWIIVSLYVMNHAASELSAVSEGAARGRGKVRANVDAISATLKLGDSYANFLKGKPSKREKIAWLIEHEARLSTREPRS